MTETILFKKDGTDVHIPEVSDEDYQYMIDKKEDDGIYAFPFVHTTPFPYIEIFIWDFGKPQRFILSEGLHMSPEYEKKYLEYARKEVHSYDDCFWIPLHRKLDIPCFKHLKYWGNCDNHIGLSLEYLFYCTYQEEYSGKAILYKEGLDIIGYNADKITWLNLDKNDINSILGEKIPERLLKTLNQDGLVERMYTKEGLKKAKEIYRKYRKYIDGPNYCLTPLTSLVQWIYLERLSENHVRFDNSVRKVFEQITNLSDDIGILDIYEEFLSLRRDMRQRFGYNFKIPNYWHIRQSGIRDVKKIREEYPEIDQLIKKRNRTSKKYEHNDKDNFVAKIILPKDLAEIYDALYRLELPFEDLKSLALGHITGDSILLLMKSESPCDPEILHALLMVKGSILEAKVIGGSIPSKSAMSFDDFILSFAYNYSKKKGLRFDLPEGYTPFNPEEDRVSDDIDEIIEALAAKIQF